MTKAPIYKDTYYTVSYSPLEYVITLDGETIASGKAYKYPDAETLWVNINKICNNYLSSDIDLILTGATAQTHYDACKVFNLENRSGNTLEEYTFLYCYDYGYSWSGQAATLSLPIEDSYAVGTKILTTTVTTGGVVTTTTSNPSKTLGCARYNLIYLNARGGWDVFTIQGNARKTDNITQYTTDRAFDNNTHQFEENRYISEIRTSYELNTHYLTDEQAEILAKHLLGSNKVYLQDTVEGKVFPVIIKDNSAVYQTYEGNGRRMAQYKISVSESQQKIRK